MKNLGKQGKDKVSGFEGTITGMSVYLHGSAQYLLTGKSVEGKKPEDYWAYVEDVEVKEE